MKKNYRGIRKWIKGLDTTTKRSNERSINSHSKIHQFSDPELLSDGRHAYYKKNGSMVRRDI